MHFASYKKSEIVSHLLLGVEALGEKQNRQETENVYQETHDKLIKVGCMSHATLSPLKHCAFSSCQSSVMLPFYLLPNRSQARLQSMT